VVALVMSEVSFGRRRFDRAATKPPASPTKARTTDPAVDAANSALPKYPGPVCTIGILLGLISVFIAQESLALGGRGYGFNYRSLIAFGADSRTLLQAGEVWRLFTAPLLHGNAGHLIGNGFALALVGLRFERLLGWGWFLTVFFISALAGDMASVFSQDPEVLGVGASGAIMGLLAAMLVSSFHAAAKGQQLRMRWLALRLMIPALLPLGGTAAAHGGLHIDYSAHAGGAAAGVILGFLMNAVWPEGEPRPLLRPLAEWVGVAGMLVAVAAFGIVAIRYPAVAAIDRTMAPDTALDVPYEQAAATANDLVKQFPDDPRLHFEIGHAYMGDRMFGPAVAELRLALSETGQLSLLPPQTTQEIRYFLAMALFGQGDTAGARQAAAPICDYAFDAPNMHETLTRTGICGDDPDPELRDGVQLSGSSR
jgi:membrane associated rhomboid family serine protease